MKCKYCQAELEANSSVCPECGKDNLKDGLKGLKITALVLVCVVMLGLLAGMICYGVTGSFLPNFGGTEDTVPTEDGVDAEFMAAMDNVVATMGEHTLTNRQLQLYYWIAAYNDTGDADLSGDLSTQIYDEATGQTYQEHFIEVALDSWQEVMLMCDLAKENGYEMPADYVEYLDSMEAELEQYVYMYAYYYGYDLETVDDLIQMQFGPGADFDSYYQYSYDYYLGGLYWSDYAMNVEVTEDQINAYFAEHEKELAEDYEIAITKDSGDLVDFRNILIAIGTKKVENEDGTVSTVEDWDACLATAQQVYDAYLAGELTEEAFIALVKEHSADTNSSGYDGLYEDMYKGCMAEVDVRHILIMPEGATSSTITTQTFSDEAWAWAENKAQEVLNTYLAGDMTEESFAELAKTNSVDGNASAGGLYEDVYVGQMVKNFEDWCFDSSRVYGDTGIVKTEFGYHVMFFVRSDKEADEWLFGQTHTPGDTAMIKTDNGYQILYFVEAEEAWHRYCRYGVKSEVAADEMEALKEANPYTVDQEKIVLGSIS